MALPYPKPTSENVSKRMRRNRKVDSKPEIAVRAALHARGLRFRKNFAVRAGDVLVRPDIVFTRVHLAVFIDGCFWHRCPMHGNVPRANSHYWRPKLDRNVRRDQLVTRELEANDWRVLRVWEHEGIEDVVDRVVAAVEAGRRA
jgi:DNA mismatch endonuclease (patch repair protein)